MSWISEKAHAELQRVRDAQAKQIYPYFRQFESGGLHTTAGSIRRSAARPSSTSARTTTSA
jgi:hypothetical protein